MIAFIKGLFQSEPVVSIIGNRLEKYTGDYDGRGSE